MSRIRVLIVDDNPTFQEIMERLLLADARLAVVGRAATGRQALELARILYPDLIVMDLSMPEMDGLETTRYLSVRPEAPAVLIVTSRDDPEYHEAVKQAGAAGLVSKQNLDLTLLDEIRRVLPERSVPHAPVDDD